MESMSGIPSFEIEFDKHGRVFQESQVTALLNGLPADATDLFVISHGWNNDMVEARELYRGFFECVAGELAAKRVPGALNRRYAIAALMWPSKKFADAKDIASGAASAGGGVPSKFLLAQIDTLEALVDDPARKADFARARELVPLLEDKASARKEMTQILLRTIPKSAEEGDRDLSAITPEDVVEKLGAPPHPAEIVGLKQRVAASVGSSDGAQREAGGAAGLDLLSGIKAGFAKLANVATYYQMKERAGVVGRGGANEVLRRVRQARPSLRLHLIGHSFGGRLVSAVALGPDGSAPITIDSLTLLQAAFSHFGFASGYDKNKDGYFRRVVSESRVRGPIVITHSKHDHAVGYAYAAASRLARQIGASVDGGKNDPYGGIGRNGAQSTPESESGELLGSGGAYAFRPRRVHNLNADARIGGHSDIVKSEIAHALLSAVAVT